MNPNRFGALVLVVVVLGILTGGLIVYATAKPHAKAVSVDHRGGSCSLHLLMHHARVEARLLTAAEASEANLPEEPELRLREGEFYRIEFSPGEIGTTSPNLVFVEIPGERRLPLRVTNIVFLE